MMTALLLLSTALLVVTAVLTVRTFYMLARGNDPAGALQNQVVALGFGAAALLCAAARWGA